MVDLLYIGFWILASSYMIAFGDCPQQLVNAFKSISPAAAGAASIGTSASSSSLNENEKNSCATWNTSLAFGYISVFFFLATFVMGVKDLWQHGWFQGFTFQGTRGNWKDQEDED